MIRWILRQLSSTLEILQKKMAPKKRRRKGAPPRSILPSTTQGTSSERTRRMWKQASRYCDELVNSVFEKHGEIALVLYAIFAVKDYLLRPLIEVRETQRPQVILETTRQFAELLQNKTTFASLREIPVLYPLSASSALSKRSHAEVCEMLGLNGLAKMKIEPSLALDLGDFLARVDTSPSSCVDTSPSSSGDVTSDEDSEVDEHSTDGSEGAQQHDGEQGVDSVPASTQDLNEDAAQDNNSPLTTNSTDDGSKVGSDGEDAHPEMGSGLTGGIQGYTPRTAGDSTIQADLPTPSNPDLGTENTADLSTGKTSARSLGAAHMIAEADKNVPARPNSEGGLGRDMEGGDVDWDNYCIDPSWLSK
ncbi:hypothetical protein NKR23_g10450 [Pleurostoma richardsiae]|uniref:Uncharacterized protein n=1 Tax=Pleurostoma richardsiae TaxID=41990 RepID=A0AA38VLH9_9PEZI|nr:hypothetical protein NKR23_g10450 [Pleurostoma richardsiae]